MTNPIDVERRFQDLLLALSLPSSPRQRLTAIAAFIVRLGDDLPLFEPYVLDLAQRIPGIVRHFQADGLPPDNLRLVYAALAGLPDMFRDIHSIAGYDDGLRMLRDSIALQYAFVGMLAESLGLYGVSLASPADGLGERPPLDRLRHALNEAKARKHESALLLARLLEAWDVKLTSPPNHAIIPVVEKSLISNDEPSVGRLRGVTVELFGEAKNGSDDIRADVAILQGARGDIFAPALAAARSMIADTLPHLAKRFFSGRIQFDDLSALHEGASANLAVTSLAYCEILHFSNQRALFQLSSRAAFTGGIDESGGILPVEVSTLLAKVEAAFFSWLDYLVVPRTQAAEAETFVQEQRQTYPRRILTIVGVGNVRDVFYDRRLSRLVVAGAFRHAGRALWRRRSVLMPVASVFILLIIVGKLLYGPTDKNPANPEYVGEMLLVKNLQGNTVDQIRVGKNTVEEANKPGPFVHHNRFFSVWDIDSDGINEMFWAEKGADSEGQLSFVGCRSVGEHSFRWRVCIRKKLSFTKRTDIENDVFRVDQIAVGNFTRSGRPEVLVLANHQMFPSLILRLDAVTGSELSYYLNIGHMGSFEIVDLDRDGLKEIIAVGANNSYRDGIVVVLDSRFISGHSPCEDNYAVNGCLPGLERFYVRIPRTVVGGAAFVHTNGANTILVNDSSQLVEIGVSDAPNSVPSNGGFQNAMLDYFFSFQFVPRTIGTSSDYDVFAEQLFRSGKIKILPDSLYLAQHLKMLLFWNGRGWQNKPVMNQRYWESMGIAR